VVSLNSTKGHEQQGRRPVVVVSNDIVNNKLVLALVVPITNTDKGHPLHVSIREGLPVVGYIKCEERLSLLQIVPKKSSFKVV